MEIAREPYNQSLLGADDWLVCLERLLYDQVRIMLHMSMLRKIQYAIFFSLSVY